ncbi:hypothetical protein MNB_SV-9-1640 [hydrothermal vent metagenome]|uniref:DUF2188 domain-containing protein n=1 Tax=hydrothermal vent metagenome TaxID=652676 RepID=A0A1W1C1H4_9ZZZZ
MHNSIHITPKGDDWQIKRADAQRASKVCTTQAECINIAKGMAKKSHSELYIHNKQGQIRAKNSYGNDPRNIKG